MKKMSRFSLLLISSILFLSIFSVGVDAESGRSFSVSPPTFDLDASHGEKIKNTIKLENISDKDLKFSTKVQNFVAYGDEGQVSLTDDDSTYSITKWIKLDKVEFIIPAKETYLFDFTISIPKNAEAGSHFGAIVFSNEGDSVESGSGANIIQEIGTLVLLKVPGEVNTSAELVSFQPSEMFFKDTNIKLDALVANTGNVHYKMNTYINVYSIFGKKLETIEGPSNNILPGNQRQFNTEFEWKRVGIYRSEAIMSYADNTKFIQGETYFISLNFAITIPVLLIILFLIGAFIVYRIRKKRA